MDEATARVRRGRAKAALTRITNALKDLTILSKHDVCNRLEKLETIYIDFDQADAALEEHLSEMADFEDCYYETKSKLQVALDKFQETIVSGSEPNIHMHTINSSIKLPQINIQSFSGKYSDWTSFKDLFESLVHKNQTISNIQKFQYLRGLLINEPAAMIKHIPVSEASYTEAWEKLVARYDNKKQIVSMLIKTFMDQSNIIRPNSINLRNMADISDEVIRGLKSLHDKATERDPWLIYILLQKVDLETRQAWAQNITKDDFPTFENFLGFLNERCTSLEMCSSYESNEKNEGVFKTPKYHIGNGLKCLKCKGNHLLFKCYKYKDLTVRERRQFVRKNKLCTNCLSDNHLVHECNSSFTCHICKNKHHSSLHENVMNYAMSVPEFNAANHNTPQNTKTETKEQPTIAINSIQTSLAILPTANVMVKDSVGQMKLIRVLMDSGSQGTFVTESCANKLCLPRKNARYPISGLADTSLGVTKGSIELTLCSLHDPKIELQLTALILNKLTGPLPAEKIKSNDFQHIRNLQLADSQFHIPSKIDIIIGSDNFFSVLLPGQVINQENNLIAQNSIFGFLIAGKLPNGCMKSDSALNLNIYELNIDYELKRFWEMEEVANTGRDLLTPEEQFCETHFQETYSSNSDGRFIVKLPFIKTPQKFGNSRGAAVSRLLAMERKFKDDPEFEKEYKAFMHEYEQLGHMTVSNDGVCAIPDTNKFYLPHHAVIKPSSSTTKLRVVFDASCKTSEGVSLNSVLGVGPKLQRDIFEILLNFRFPRIVFTADVEKMYRQILVSPEDQKYQSILWRYSTDDEILEYTLRTVTYGMSSASYVATRCLKQIAIECNDPEVARTLQEDIFMDDVLSGANTDIEAISMGKRLSLALQARGFNLRKWNSNSAEFLAEFREHSSLNSDLEIVPKESSKVLGLFWNPSADTFNFKAILQVASPLTKRRILAESARIFDPLGLLSPCTVVIKIFYQKLWIIKGDWDAPVPQHLSEEWFKYQEAFHQISDCKIPRCVTLAVDCTFQLHGFCDASSLAYAAVIYCRQVHDSEIKTNLLVSKTKVAPIKQVSIPRLELCGAHLLAKLFKLVLNTMKNVKFEFFAWTDSKVVLAWLTAHPRKWKTFVANRTSLIMEVIPSSQWNHVPSKQNPADLASRGLDPKTLPQCDMWWNGPSWLSQEKENWPDTTTIEERHSEALKEQRTDPMFCSYTSQVNDTFEKLFEYHSSFSKIVRIIAYCKRFIGNARYSALHNRKSSDNNSLSLTAINESTELIIRWIQSIYFKQEIDCIKAQKQLKKGNALLSLSPFVDQSGILRVGGRLIHSELAYRSKYPAILPCQHTISELLIKQYHITYLHAGATLLSHVLKQKYWIIGAKRLINKVVRRCVTCFRFKPTPLTQVMGNLPEHRVTLERPFSSSGIDYAGPIKVKFNKGRGNKTTKGYIALFICLATKAIHLEVVSDYTAETFIAALRRFSSRRGTPRHIYSDNGTNFVGARNKLTDYEREPHTIPNMSSVCNYLNQSEIEWHMIPPSSPHFGGLWEAGVRSVKFHLRRVIGDTLLTYEELATLLAQIEAVLNCRPLTYTNDSDPDSIQVLTPSHFLTGDILTSVPDVHFNSRASRWELLQNLRKCFWKRWRQEYLTSLQQRSKWHHPQPNISIGEVVLVHEDNSSPSFWPLGRVVEVHPGTDGLIRVATVKTNKGLFRRPIIKLSPLPLYQA